jgi:tetratricopeptide (TPR) repeat protein
VSNRYFGEVSRIYVVLDNRLEGRNYFSGDELAIPELFPPERQFEGFDRRPLRFAQPAIASKRAACNNRRPPAKNPQSSASRAPHFPQIPEVANTTSSNAGGAFIALPTLTEVERDLRLWREADPQLSGLLALGIAPANALRHLGLSAWGRGDPVFAANVFKAAAALTPDDAGVWADLSGVLYACARKGEALASLLVSLERDENAPGRWLSLAALYRETGKLQEAGQAFRNAIRLEPASADAWVGLGMLLFEQRQFPLKTNRGW